MAKKKTGQAAKTAKNAARYRKLYRQAAKKGLVKSGKPKDFTPSKYMRARLRELEPYLGSDYKAVTATPELKKVWKDAPSEIVPLTFNRKLIVKAPADAKVSTKGGVLSIRRHLGTGEFEQLPLPVTASNLKEFREWIASNKYYNDILKHRDEVFNFRIYGNDSYGSFGDLESLLDELEKYDNFEDQDWESSEDFFGHFELFRSFRDWSTSEHARNKRKHDRDRRDERKRKALARMTPEERERHLERKREYRAARRAKQKGYQRELEKRKEARKNETPEAREKRLAKQRATMQRSRERARAKRD